MPPRMLSPPVPRPIPPAPTNVRAVVAASSCKTLSKKDQASVMVRFPHMTKDMLAEYLQNAGFATSCEGLRSAFLIYKRLLEAENNGAIIYSEIGGVRTQHVMSHR